jgi:hypothetical protein
MREPAQQAQRGDGRVEVNARYPRGAHADSECRNEVHRAGLYDNDGGEVRM